VAGEAALPPQSVIGAGWPIRICWHHDSAFSTYASWAIMNNLSRDSRQNRRRDPFVTGYEAMLDATPDLVAF
jgi:hypothetical protein